MWADRSAYFAFLISFVVIANHWGLHHRLYRSVSRLDRRIVTLALLTVAAAFAISIPVALASRSQWTFVIWIAAGFGARTIRRLRAPDPT